MGCATWFLLVIGFVLLIVSLIRWFEQVTEAVKMGWWNKVFVLLAMPLTVWLFPSQTPTGRPGAVPRHEPVRGFGKLPRGGIGEPMQPDQPPPGTRPEFLVKPVVPPPKAKASRAGLDPDKIAKLKQKMRDQGMLPPDSE